MNPVTRFVKEVERNLSGQNLLNASRLQTSAMIYKDLSNRVDALEERLGRKPDDAEMAALLAEFGAPAEVAARYSAMTASAPSRDLVERYLAAMEHRLPKEQARDIVAELREAIGERIDAKSRELGREAGPGEIAAILKEFGHPTLVASRYQSQQHLIGPNLYPWFWPAQRTALGITLAVMVVLTALDVFDSQRPVSEMIASFFGWWDEVFVVFGIVTVVFMVMERSEVPVKFAKSWDPKMLPHDNVRKPRPLFDTLFGLAFDAIFILWWVGVITLPQALASRAGRSVIVEPTAVWEQVWLPVLILAALTAAVHVADLVHPAWSRLRAAVSIAGHAGGIAIAVFLLQSKPLLTSRLAPEAREQLIGLQPVPELVLTTGLVIAAVIWAIALGLEAWRLFHATKPSRPLPPPAGAPA